MIAKKLNVPVLRFPAFQGEWKRSKARVLFHTISDKKHNGGLEVLSVTQEKGPVPRDSLDIDIKYDKENVRNYKRICEGNFVISLRSFQGGLDRSEYEGLVSPAYTVFDFKSPSQHYGKFFALIFKSGNFINRLNTLTYGIRDGKAISFSDFGEVFLNHPSLAEQQKIASFFSLLDHRIEKQQEKISCLEEYKKGLMQKIFSQEIRFKDENGEDYPKWEERAFGQLFMSLPTKNYQILSSEVCADGKYEVVDQGASCIAGFCDTDEKLFGLTPVIVYGDHTTIVKYRVKPFIVGADGVKLLKSRRKNDDVKYLFYALQYRNIKPEGYKRHFPILKGVYLPVCALKEQRKIEQVLSKMDELIEKNKELLEQWKLLRKGLLQQMFV